MPKRQDEFFLILSIFDEHDKTQLLAKFKIILYMGFRATLNFRIVKVALNPMYRIYLNFAKRYILYCLSKYYKKKKNSQCGFWNITSA